MSITIMAGIESHLGLSGRLFNYENFGHSFLFTDVHVILHSYWWDHWWDLSYCIKLKSLQEWLIQQAFGVY
jgi:hypothetical protein